MELFKNGLQTGGIWKRRLGDLVGTENSLKTELYETDNIISLPVFLKHESNMAAEMVIAMRMLTGALKRFCRL